MYGVHRKGFDVALLCFKKSTIKLWLEARVTFSNFLFVQSLSYCPMRRSELTTILNVH